MFQDIVEKLLLFSQHRPRALCVLSGTGTVSSVTLRQPASTSVSVTYEVRELTMATSTTRHFMFTNIICSIAVLLNPLNSYNLVLTCKLIDVIIVMTIKEKGRLMA